MRQLTEAELLTLADQIQQNHYWQQAFEFAVKFVGVIAPDEIVRRAELYVENESDDEGGTDAILRDFTVETEEGRFIGYSENREELEKHLDVFPFGEDSLSEELGCLPEGCPERFDFTIRPALFFPEVYVHDAVEDLPILVDLAPTD